MVGVGGWEGKKKGLSWEAFSFLVNSCSCMQMQANTFKIYPVETLPSMEKLSALFYSRGHACSPEGWRGEDKGVEAGVPRRGGGGLKGHTRFSIY